MNDQTAARGYGGAEQAPFVVAASAAALPAFVQWAQTRGCPAQGRHGDIFKTVSASRKSPFRGSASGSQETDQQKTAQAELERRRFHRSGDAGAAFTLRQCSCFVLYQRCAVKRILSTSLTPPHPGCRSCKLSILHLPQSSSRGACVSRRLEGGSGAHRPSFETVLRTSSG